MKAENKNTTDDNSQMSLFDMLGNQEPIDTSKDLDVVKAAFLEGEKKSWKDLFEGFDEMYAITFSSGLSFASNLIDKFEYAEIIFGCENVLNNGVVTAMAVGKAMVEQISKSKAVEKLCTRMSEDSLKLYVSREFKSHEKIFCLKSKEGKFRVITGSANMSASAFYGFQRENITYYDDEAAYDWYMYRFENFKSQCSDNINYSAILAKKENPEYLDDHPEEIPIAKTVEKKGVIVVEPISDEDEESQLIVANVKGLEDEIKPMLPKPKKESGKLMLASSDIRTLKQKNSEYRTEKNIKYHPSICDVS